MAPDRDGGRASKACTACRRQKTRCYDGDSGSCLRCRTLSLSCSLGATNHTNSDGYDRAGSVRGPAPSRPAAHAVEPARVAHLEKVVADLASRLEAVEKGESRRRAPQPQVPDDDAAVAPVVLLRDVAEEVGASPDDSRSAQPVPHEDRDDIVTKGILTYEAALPLAAIFHEHYGRWVVLDPQMTSTEALEQLRKTPLLFCASCLIAVRHRGGPSAAALGEALFTEAKRLISASMLTVPQSLDYFKATVVLSFWSTTIGKTPLGLDSWLISGIALQHCLAVPNSSPMSERKRSHAADNRSSYEYQCVWNHICLAHLHYAVGTRRKAMLERHQIDKARVVLSAKDVTEFEVRIVAEIDLYWVMYEQCCLKTVDLPQAQAALTAWRNEWTSLFHQPRSTFLRMGLHFAQLIAFDQSMRKRSNALRESLLVETIQTSMAVLDLAIVTTDDRTKHLSDHIYHLIAFAAVTICRLLHKHEQQLSAAYEPHELDDSVMRVVTWLHSVGPPSHVGHTFGNVVAALHKKLRPNAHLTSPTSSYQDVDPFYDAEFASMFPDLLSTDLVSGASPELLMDWQGFVGNADRA